MSFINFESSWKKAKDREALREARDLVLDKAKHRYEKEQERKSREEKWMLPDLEERIKRNKKHKKKENKNKKKKKKKKKSSKKKKKSNQDSSSSSDNSDDDDEEWVEKKQEVVKTERDSWMTGNDEFSAFGKDFKAEKSESAKQKLRRENDEKRSAEQKRRELNPNLRDPSIGVSDRGAGSVVRDGGANWLRRAYKRAQEQAESEGKSIEEIAAERWGSLAAFKRMLARAEEQESKGQTKRSRSRERRRRRRSSSRSSSSNHSDDRRKRRKFTKPKEAEDEYEGRSRRRSRSRSRDRRRRRTTSRSSSDSSYDRSRREKKSKFAKPGEGHDDEDGGYEKSFCSSNWRRSGWKTEERKEIEKRLQMEQQTSKRTTSKRAEMSSSSGSESENKSENEKKLVKKEEEKIEEKMLTDQELNALGAKLVKAEMLGNVSLARKLKQKLEMAKKLREDQGSSKYNDVKRNENRDEVVLLTKTDSKGMSRPVESMPDEMPQGSGHRRYRKEKVKTHDQEGKRTKFFADDDKYNLKQMFEREKLSSAEDQNQMLSRLAGRAANIRQNNETDYDLDDLISDAAASKVPEAKLAERERDRAIGEHKRLNKTLDDCKRCVENKNAAKHLMVALGEHCYLALPHHTSLTWGHCWIIPRSHVGSSVIMDEDLWEEVQRFRKALVRMFEDEDEDCVFFETCTGIKYHPHAVIECVSIPKEVGEMAPMYFQKAIQECESEWSHNKKLVSLREKNIRRAVPKGLPYFRVDFGNDDGFAHVIEDEQDFPANFPQEIVGGMLDLEPRFWKNPKRETFEAQKGKVMKFGAKFRPFNFTSRKNAADSSSSSGSSESE